MKEINACEGEGKILKRFGFWGVVIRIVLCVIAWGGRVKASFNLGYRSDFWMEYSENKIWCLLVVEEKGVD